MRARICTLTVMAFAVGTSVSGLWGRVSAAEAAEIAEAEEITGPGEVTKTEPAPFRLYGQVGLGLLEIAHVEAGAFLGRHLAVEGTMAFAGVLGARYGAGLFYLLGHAEGVRPPQHAFLLGARLMLNSDATFDTHGEDLSSYGVIPIGYSYISDRGFFFRATIGGVVARQRTTRDGPMPGTFVVDHQVGFGGPMFTVAFGGAWTWQQVKNAF